MIRVTRHDNLLHIETDIGSISIHDEVLRSGNPSFETRILCYLADYLEKPRTAAPVGCNVEGTWLWSKLMDWCRRQRIAPATQGGLFAIASEAHALNASAPAAPGIDLLTWIAVSDRLPTEADYGHRGDVLVRYRYNTPNSVQGHWDVGDSHHDADFEWNQGWQFGSCDYAEVSHWMPKAALLALIDASPKGGSDAVQIPDTEGVREILGRMCFQCIRLAEVLRLRGDEIRRHAEDEQAAVLRFLLNHYLAAPEKWAEHAQAEIDAIRKQATSAEVGA